MNFTKIREIWKEKCRGEPESAIYIYILGTILYNTNKNEGIAACSLVLHKNMFELNNKNEAKKFSLNQKQRKILETLNKKPNIIRSYIKDIKDIEDPKLYLRKKEVARSRAKILIKSKLKDAPATFCLVKDADDYWKIVEGTSTLLDNIE